MSITEVLKHSLHQAAQDLRDKSRAKQQKQLWRDSGLIGALDDDAEHLSVNYKQQLPDYLNEKHPAHVSEALGHGRILSTDQRDFNTYRWKNHEPFENLLITGDSRD